jgi:hypothetical protein
MLRRPAAPVLVLLASAALGACGSGAALIPANTAMSLDEALQHVRDATAAGNCRTANANLERARTLARTLPATVDERLRTRLNSGIAQLTRTVPDQCSAAADRTPTTPSTSTTPSTTTTTAPTTTSTTTTQPTTTTTQPTTTTTTPTTTTQPTGPNGGISPDQPTTGTTP